MVGILTSNDGRMLVYYGEMIGSKSTVVETYSVPETAGRLVYLGGWGAWIHNKAQRAAKLKSQFGLAVIMWSNIKML